MIEELRLTGLGTITEATLAFSPGFTAITGETGAGKTMLLTALGLLLGGRGDSGAIASSADRIEVEGRFAVPGDGSAARRVEEAGGTLDEAILILSRTVNRDGRSRATAGGRSVPAALLGELADSLITIHGQADQRGLLRPAVQRAALDRYAGRPVIDALAAYRRAFEALRDADTELALLLRDTGERERERQSLRAGLAEIATVAPEVGEERRLTALVQRLAHVDALRVAAASALADLRELGDDEPPAAIGRVAAARAALEAVRGHDSVLDELAGRAVEVSYLLEELASDLAHYEQALDADPAALQTATARLARLRTLVRAHGLDVDGILDWAALAESRFAELGDDDSRATALRDVRNAALAQLVEAAGTLSGARRHAAVALSKAVTAELAGLAMTGAECRIDCRHRPDARGIPLEGRSVAFGVHGADEVEFLLRPHPGAPLRPLSRGASGGELSRVMLAFEVVLAAGAGHAAFVFDEVDAGVGGRAAVEIGRRLSRLSRSAQVIVVTHLPQVAAFADQHLVVHKTSSAAGSTASAVDAVDGEDRLEELARMLGGLADSELGRAHAAELLDLAAAERPAGQRGSR